MQFNFLRLSKNSLIGSYVINAKINQILDSDRCMRDQSDDSVVSKLLAQKLG